MKKDSVPDMYGKIQDESSALGNLAAKIPGFSGYIEKGRRREADQILRETIASRLEASRMTLSNALQELSRDIVKAMDHAEPLGRADTRLMGLIGKIRDAPQGYAGFFDAVKIKEDDLTRIYAFDESMLAYSAKISEEVNMVEIATVDSGDIDDATRTLDITLREANATFDSRQEILSGVS
jgi:hypothetical protein